MATESTATESREAIIARVKPETGERLRALAEADHRSLSNYLAMVLERHVEEGNGSP
jgi:predicted DNA-binding protein